MGKKSKTDKVKSKIHVKVKKSHIHEAHERLRLKYNKAFDSHVEKDELTKRVTDKSSEQSEITESTTPPSTTPTMDYDNLLEQLTKILDFYRDEKIPRDVMISDNQIDPVLMAYNTLCDQGIKRTVSHGQQLHLPGEKFRILFMRAYYGRDNVAENQNVEEDADLEERYQEIVKNMANKFLKNPTQIPSPEEAASAMATAMAQSAVKKSQTSTDTTTITTDQSQNVQGDTVDTSQTITEDKVDDAKTSL